MKDKGKVFLVGAGPGDPDLITVKGIRLLQEADSIIYDHLVSPQLLEHTQENAEKIYVGKQDSRHTMHQSEINGLLVKRAKENRMVVRLKGGDPFVFGRGGEEALFLESHQIPFEIVPGISSAIAGPAYAGIPVTHRDHTSSVLIVTGHQKTSATKTAINWKNLADHAGTLVLLMGVHNLKQIVTQLQKNGKSPETPIALIQWATWKEQRTVQGTLNDIVEKVRQAELTPPALIVVGEVVRLREKIRWFD